MATQSAVLPGYTSPEVAQVTVRNIQDAEDVVSYVNRRANPNDIVLAPPHVAWMIEAQVAETGQSQMEMVLNRCICCIF